jgi:V8-like Glu-specific endopeptidase
MFVLRRIVRASLGAILLSFLTANPTLAELSLEKINSIARQTTVIIAPGLTPKLVKELEANRNNPLARKNNPDGVWNPGSGVIIAKQDSTYYVLTVTHNFKQKDLDQNVIYGIRTSDGKVHQVTQINDGRNCPLNGSTTSKSRLWRFGCYSLAIPTRIAGTDLAVVGFNSDIEYPIASLGNVNNTKVGERVYISGWPDPEKEKNPSTGECRGKIARRQRRLAWTPVTRTIDPQEGENGYSIFYVDETRPGMSGGPVFDNNGFLIGIHGRGSADKGNLVNKYCSLPAQVAQRYESEDLSKDLSEAVSYTSPILHDRFSSGQNLNNFITLWQPLNINLPFNLQPPSPKIIQAALSSLPKNASETGVLEFDPSQDLTGRLDLSDPKDTVEDIYEGFSLKNMLRDEPSAGCPFLLLGERCK